MDLLRELLAGQGGTSKSGKVVNAKTALQVATVFACCRVIGEGIAQVPLKLMKESPDGRVRLPAKDAPLYNLLAFKPNAWQTSFEYREMLAWHVVLTGAHFSFINRGAGAQILELIPFLPGNVTVLRDPNYRLRYQVRAENGALQDFPAEAIWHVRGPSWDGWQGLDAVKAAREAIGLAMASEEAVARLHKQGLLTSGTYSVEGTLKQEQYEALAAWIQKHAAGSENAGRPLILDRQAKWLSTQMSSVDAQTSEMRRFQVEEICRFARVNPIMVGAESKNTTYASAEQMFLAHVVHTLAPWYQRIEQSIDAFLLTQAERDAGLYSNFVEEGLLRGSIKDTKDTLLGYVNGGLMTPNEGRAKLDLNPDADPESDKLRIPANITGASPGEAPPAAVPGAGKDAPAPIINVDARTTLHSSPVTIAEGAVHASVHVRRDEQTAESVAGVAQAITGLAVTVEQGMKHSDANAQEIAERAELAEARTGKILEAISAPRVATLVRDAKGEAVSGSPGPK